MHPRFLHLFYHPIYEIVMTIHEAGLVLLFSYLCFWTYTLYHGTGKLYRRGAFG
ncbi:hypothetical protein BDR05DRAFT_966011 [Suillus weaverae]|nr:hypothetical protein BDR05DRAFT_966011 [Suillus weaverae]